MPTRVKDSETKTFTFTEAPSWKISKHDAESLSMRPGDLSNTRSIQGGSGWRHFTESLPGSPVVRLSVKSPPLFTVVHRYPTCSCRDGMRQGPPYRPSR